MVILVMGVTGSGKSTVGEKLASRLGWKFLDADDFHSEANREKMRRGIPLTDPDRTPWLDSIHQALLRLNTQGENTVLACSALREAYRAILRAGLDMRVVFLRATPADLHRNLSGRTGHFAGEDLVPSQMATLEEPCDAVIESVASPPDEIVEDVCKRLGLFDARP